MGGPGRAASADQASQGLQLAPGELLATATGRGAQLEGVTAVLLLTAEDDFNALGSTVLQGSVERTGLPARPHAGPVTAWSLPTPAARSSSTHG